MLSAGDSYAAYLNTLDQAEAEYEDRDELARSLDVLILQFAWWRKWARNSLWISVMLILVSCGVQTFQVLGWNLWTVMLALILVAGIIAVPVTVKKFRGAYRPLLIAYRH